jgi:hypothetical protein
MLQEAKMLSIGLTQIEYLAEKESWRRLSLLSQVQIWYDESEIIPLLERLFPLRFKDRWVNSSFYELRQNNSLLIDGRYDWWWSFPTQPYFFFY